MSEKRDKEEVTQFIPHTGFIAILICMTCMIHIYSEDIYAASQETVLDAHGFGLPRPQDKTHAERCIFARSAAEIDARRILASNIQSHIESLSKTSDKRLDKENTEVRVNHALIGAKIVKVNEYSGCDRVEVHMQVAVDLREATEKKDIDEAKINRLAKLMVDGCSLGQNVSFEARADGGISLWKRGGKIDIKASKNQIPSIITFITSDEKRIEASNETRECIKHFMDKIFSAILE